MAYERDILEDFDPRRKPVFPSVEAVVGMVVEDRASGFCGDIVKLSTEAVTLRARDGQHRHFRWKEGGFLVDGRPMTLARPAPPRTAGPKLTASGSIAVGAPMARTARASRIWVEGRHDAELLEHVWGDDLRDLGIVVEPLHGIDDLVAAVRDFGPAEERRLGILVDHLVAGSKETRLARSITDPNVLVTGHPFVDVWAGIRPKAMGLDAWPDVPRGIPWKEGMCRALGTDLAGFWPKLRNRVTTYADLRPELVGAVERLIDFVAGAGAGDD
ncbi:MAG: DUF3097 family protein [Acidimicrobiia bacterium]